MENQQKKSTKENWRNETKFQSCSLHNLRRRRMRTNWPRERDRSPLGAIRKWWPQPMICSIMWMRT